jgi:hypothetical protein
LFIILPDISQAEVLNTLSCTQPHEFFGFALLDRES